MSLMASLGRGDSLIEDEAGLGHVRFQGRTEAPLHPDSHALVAYCEARRSQDGILRRDAIRPREIPNLLPHLFIAERAAAGWRYRLFGTTLVDRLGVEVTGRAVRDIFEAKTAARVSDLYDAVLAGGRPISRRGRFFGIGRAFFVTESTQFPMLARDGRTRMIVGGLFFFDSAATPIAADRAF